LRGGALHRWIPNPQVVAKKPDRLLPGRGDREQDEDCGVRFRQRMLVFSGIPGRQAGSQNVVIPNIDEDLRVLPHWPVRSALGDTSNLLRTT
jgi:hypothetical protein